MSLSSLAQPKVIAPIQPEVISKPKGLAGLAKPKAVNSTKIDLNTLEGLKQKAVETGYTKEAQQITDTAPKLSVLQRLGKGLGAFNPANALITGQEKGAGEGILEYGKNIGQGIGSTITGVDYEQDRKTFKDVAERMGVTNGIAKWGIGFAGDVLLDPSTYFGGAIAKGIGKVLNIAGGTALKGIGKVAPMAETGLRMTGTGLQEAVGRAFEYGFKATKGAKEDVLSFLSQQQKAKLGLAASNLDRLGTGVLNKSQREELVLKMVAGKRAEFGVRESAKKIALSADEFNPISNRIDKMIETRGGYVQNLQKSIDRLEKTGLKKSLKLKQKVTPSLVSAIKIKKVPDKVTFGTGIEQDVVTGGKLGYTKMADIPAITAAKGTQSTKSFIESLITDPNKDVQALKRQVSTKENNLSSVFDEIDNLKTEYQKIQNLKQKRLQLADTTFGMKGGVARETAESSDPLVQKTINEQIERNKKFGEQIGLQNPYEVYFPFIKKDKVDKFMKESYGLRVGSEGYRKQFKNLLTNENLELDPAKAFFTRESQVVSDNMTRGFLNGFVQKYGKPLDAFKNNDEAAKAGYQLIKDKGMFGKEIGYVSKYDGSLLRDSLSPEFQTINMLAKATGFDAVTSLFKRSVTGLFAPFHIRNFVSGNIQNFEVLGKDAINPQNIAIGQKIAYLMGSNKKISSDVINIAGKPTKLKTVMQPFIDRFSGDTFYNTDFDMALKNGDELKSLAGLFSKQRLKETVKTAGFGQEAIHFKAGRAVGQFIEHSQKATAYITALGQGKTTQEALSLAEKAGFDYRSLTRFESQIMKRLIPFYSFTRKNLELQMKTLGENPQRINQVLSFFSNMGETPSQEERQNLPGYLQESIGIKLEDSPEGLKQYLSSFGTPIEQVAQMFGKNPILRAISMMNPMLKAPIEIGIGKDSFRQQDLKDVYNAKEYKMAPQFIKDLLEIKAVMKPVYDKDKKGNLVKIGEKEQYIANPERLLIARSLFTSRGVSYLDQVFGNDLNGFLKFLKTTTGLKPQQIDLEVQKYYNEKEKKDKLQDLLLKTGDIKQFKTNYMPKQ